MWMESKGSFTMDSNEQMCRCRWGWKTETPFPSQLSSHLGFCSKSSSHSPGFKGGELPWAGEGVVL